MKRLSPWLALVAGLLIIAFVVRQCRNEGAANYQTATITSGPITQAVTATGTLNPVVNVQVGSEVSGNVAKLFADFNSQVKAGQVVAQIDPALFQATVTQAEGDLANAQAALELAKLNARRTQELFAKKTSSQADVDQAMANFHQAEANVKIKQGALDKAKGRSRPLYHHVAERGKDRLRRILADVLLAVLLKTRGRDGAHHSIPLSRGPDT